MKYTLIIFVMICCAGSFSCKKKTCPAYQEDQKEEYKMSGKRKKAKLF